MQELKTKRQVTHEAKSESELSMFRRQYESLFAIGLSLWMYHNLRSQKAINLLSKCGVGVSYSGVTHACSHIANAVQENIKINGVFLPLGIVTGRAIRAAADNVDKQVDTHDGKVGMPKKNDTEHHRLNQTTVVRQEQDIENLSRGHSPCNIFTSEETSLFKLMTKEIIPKPIEKSILSMEACGSSVMKKFVEERISGETNLWDKMTKSKFLSWDSSGKEIKLQAKSEVITLRTTTGLMSRLLIIAQSSREVDMEEVIGN
ncbi:Hypothetical predicted protein [Paramuricea clavata]|uniref:Uncharacterized protein n=1 Tax=Paramuricea clavata TaxID=317549 RepID=A0A6S7GUB3_PARCT|nr:Hypothetical predicted protein [Paramuricea clavata]